MRLSLLPLAVLLLAALAPGVSASNHADPTPGNRWVESTFTFTQPDLRTLELDGRLLFHEYDVDGTRYTADDMGEAYVNANTFTRGPARGNELVAKIEAQARASLESTLAAAFPTATRTIEKVELDRSTLVAASGSAYEPAVLIVVRATIERTNADVGLGTYSDPAVAAVFGAGAVVSTTFSLSSQAGYDSVYEIRAPASPAGLVFAAPSGEGASLSADRKTLTVRLDNVAGAATLSRSVGVQVQDATAAAPAAEDIRSTVEISLGELGSATTSLPISTNVTARLHAVDIAKRFPGILPEKVRLTHLSADALRALRAAGAVSDADLARADGALLDTIRDDLSAALKSPVTVTGGLSRSDLAAGAARPYDADPPVRFTASASGAYPIEGGGIGDLDLVLRIGGRFTFSLDLFAAKSQATTFVLQPPPGVRFVEAGKGTLAADGASATFLVPAAGEGSTAFPVTVTMARAGAPSHDAEKAELGVIVDLKDLDITLGKAMGGDLGELVVEVTVTGNLGVLKLPDDLKAAIDPRVKLDYVDSDALRLLREAGLLDDANLSAIEAKLLDEVKRNLASALGAPVEVTGGFDRATLDPARVGDKVDGDDPVVFRAATSFRKSLVGAPSAQAAIALYTQQQSFDLPKVQGLDTAYTVILPRGLAVTGLEASGGESETGTSADGRDQFTVRPTEDQARATVSMAVTPTFVMIKFWPVVLLAVMVLVLLVGTPVALVVMRRKKKGSAGKK